MTKTGDNNWKGMPMTRDELVKAISEACVRRGMGSFGAQDLAEEIVKLIIEKSGYSFR